MAAEFTTEGTADILGNQNITRLGCRKYLMSNPGLHLCSKLSAAVRNFLAITKIVVSSYHPNGNGGVERVNNMVAQMLLRVVKEWRNDWDKQLPQVESALNNLVSTVTGLTPNEAHMGRLSQLRVTMFDFPNVGGHRGSKRDQLAYCDLANDRQ